jgi:hypothetical protein
MLPASISAEHSVLWPPPLSIDDARRAVDRFVNHYNTTRLHSAIGYVTPLDMLEGRQKSILEARDCKLEEARLLRGEKRRQQKLEMPKNFPAKATHF